MAHLDVDRITQSVLNKSVIGNEVVRIQQVPDIQVQNMKFKLSQEEWKNTTACVVCRQEFNPQKNLNKHHCRVCGSSVCGECSRKKINKQRACDFCFLKQHLKKFSHERKQMFKNRELAIEKMTQQTKQNQIKIEKLDHQIAELEKSNLETEIEQSRLMKEMEVKVKVLTEQLREKQESLAERKEKLEERKKELLTREEKNKLYEDKVQNLKLDISCKQISQLEKMQELEKLKIQLQNLEREKKDILKQLGAK